jgi:hypothetical protein
MYECYADGWDGRAYQHILIYLKSTQIEAARDTEREFMEVYGCNPEFVMVVPIGFDRVCA